MRDSEDIAIFLADGENPQGFMGILSTLVATSKKVQIHSNLVFEKVLTYKILIWGTRKLNPEKNVYPLFCITL